MPEQLGKFAKSLRQGQTIYKVYALGEQSYMDQCVVGSRVKRIGVTQYLGIDVITYHEHVDYFGVKEVWIQKSSESLGDMNALFGDNGYNHHRIFFSKKKAEKYLNMCTETNLNSMNEHEDLLYDYCDQSMTKYSQINK